MGLETKFFDDITVKNLIINGAFEIWQRNTTFALGGSSGYTADRFLGLNCTVNQVLDYTENGNGALVNSSGAGPGNPCLFLQRIEPTFLKEFLGKKMVVSFVIQGTIAGSIVHRGFISKTTSESFSHTEVPVTTTPTRLYFEYDLTNLTDLSDVNYVESVFDIFTDNAFSQQTGIDYPVGLSESTYLGAITVGDWMVYEQPEFGDIERPFQRATDNIEQEIALCQRYFEKSYSLDVAVGATSPTAYPEERANSSEIRRDLAFKVEKRVVPVGTIYSPVTGNAGFARNFSTNSDIARTAVNIRTSAMGFFSSTTSGQLVGWHWTADAEL